MTLARDQKRNLSPKPAEDCAKNAFGAPNPPRIASKTDLEPKTCLVLHKKSILSPKPAGFHVKNRILHQNEARFTGFGYTSASIGATNGAFGYTSPTKTRRATT